MSSAASERPMLGMIARAVELVPAGGKGGGAEAWAERGLTYT
jgi:hypothetical protein